MNDISGLHYDPPLGEVVVAACGAALILMHTRGRSSGMYDRAGFADAAQDVVRELGESVDRAVRAGVSREAIIVDPGLGFAKRAEHSYDVLARIGPLGVLDRPLPAGPPRKSFLKAALGERRAVRMRVWGTAARGRRASPCCVGAHIVRVHDVRAPMVDGAPGCRRRRGPGQPHESLR